MERSQNTILYVSFVPDVAKKRQKALESARMHVVLVAEPEAVLVACKQHRPRLLLIGRSVPPAEKRGIWCEVRNACTAPILELEGFGGPHTHAARLLH